MQILKGLYPLAERVERSRLKNDRKKVCGTLSECLAEHIHRFFERPRKRQGATQEDFDLVVVRRPPAELSQPDDCFPELPRVEIHYGEVPGRFAIVRLQSQDSLHRLPHCRLIAKLLRERQRFPKDVASHQNA